MKITFRIQYHTNWGEELGVMLNGDMNHVVALTSHDGNVWSGSIESAADAERICYRYGVYVDGHCIRRELGRIGHSFLTVAHGQQTHYVIEDCWRDLPAGNFRYSSAFAGAHHPEGRCQPDGAGEYVCFRALCPGLHSRGQILAVAGEGEALGNWNRAVRMQEVEANVWELAMESSRLAQGTEYKFVAVNAESGQIEAWECRDNRRLYRLPQEKGECSVLMETEVDFHREERKIAGTAIPVFSLRTEGSCGVGDFGDLKTFIDWAVLTHQRAVQILPINDTTITNTWQDSYPYNSISIYAFHPMYIDVRQLPALKDEAYVAAYEEERRRLNALPAVDYEAVNRLKRGYLRMLFNQEGERTLSSGDYREFYRKNEHWLKPYGAFSYLRDLNGTPDFSLWKNHNEYAEAEVDELCREGTESHTEICFYFYLQYLLHVQLLAASDYAREKGVVLKGDIPIGISRASVEAWVEPYYFNMNGQAGAPPDAFSTKGQNWGFPTYNWEVMEKDSYLWWRRRFAKMSEYFTAYRIDHILGFFRIWEIPTHSVHGLLGQFVPALPMSVEEIGSYGLYFQKEFMTEPFINEEMLHEMFGEWCEEVKNTFLLHTHDDIYRMRSEFDTQRKVEAYFRERTDEVSVHLREGLYALVSNVLFVADRKNPEMYHPRIAVQNDYIYKRLSEQEKEAFNRLYNHYYYHRHNEFWYGEAMKKLPILTQSTGMLVCGEDLGMVPECVPWVMQQLQILSLEIQRMPKDPENEFGHVWQYPENSVCSIGTHDMSTFRGWWEENSEVSAHFYYNELHHEGGLPKEAPEWLCREVVEQHLYSPSLLCILTWQDWTSIDASLRNPDVEAERINIPANPRHYWRWRMHVTIEELMGRIEFNEQVAQLIDAAGR